MKQLLNSNIVFSSIIYYLFFIIVEYILIGNLMMSIDWVLLSCFIVTFFFLGSYIFYKNTQNLPSKKFITNLIILNIVIKFIFITINYFYYKSIYGIAILGSSDHLAYYEGAVELSKHFRNFDFSLNIISDFSLSDYGAYIYYGIIYTFFGNNIYVASLTNMVFATYTTVLLYKTIRIINTEHIARLTAIFFSLIPIFNYYVGNHLKETFFIWLIVYGTYQLIFMFEQNRLILNRFLILLLVIFSLFLYRTVVALAFIMSVGIYIITVKKTKIIYKVMAITIAIFSIFMYTAISTIGDETDNYYSKYEEGNADYGSTYKLEQKRGSNSIANKLTGLPIQMALTVIGPFPTIIKKTNTKNYGEVIGLREKIPDAFIKAFLSFFFILGVFNWKNLISNYFLSSFILSNIFIVSISGLSLTYRFLLPIMPFFIYFSILGLNSKTKIKNTYYVYIFIIITIYYFFNETKLIDFNY